MEFYFYTMPISRHRPFMLLAVELILPIYGTLHAVWEIGKGMVIALFKLCAMHLVANVTVCNEAEGICS